MKRISLLSVALFASLAMTVAPLENDSNPTDSTLRHVDNQAFKVGEYLKYKLRYGILSAGYAELGVRNETERKGRPVYHIVGKGWTVGMVDLFFPTNDVYESYIDTEAMVPWEFIRDVNEGGFEIKRHLVFDHFQDEVKDLKEAQKKTYKIPENAQDILSSFYYARCLNLDTLKNGEEVMVDVFLDHEHFPFKLKLLGREKLSTDWGKVQCMKFRPVVQSGRVFKDNEDMTIWVTDDENKIPVLLKTKLVVGSIKMELIEYRNTSKPIKFQK